MNGFVYLLIIIAIICVMWVGFDKERRSLIYGGVMAFLVVSVVWGFSLDSPSPKTPISQMTGIPMPPDGKIYRAIIDTDLYDDRQLVRFYSDTGSQCVFLGEASGTAEKTTLPFGVEGFPGTRWEFHIFALKCRDRVTKVKMQALPVVARINIREGDEFIVFDVE